MFRDGLQRHNYVTEGAAGLVVTGRPAWQIINVICLYQQHDKVGFVQKLNYTFCFPTTEKLQPEKKGAGKTETIVCILTFHGQTT